MMAPKRVRIAYSVSLTVKSENATNSSSPATTKNQGKRRELISALPSRAAAFDRDLVRGILGTPGGSFRARLQLAFDALLEQLLDREVQEIVPGVRVDDHLVRPRQHVLDGVGVEAPPRHLRRLRIGRLELQETRRLAFGDRGHLCLVGLRILLDARGPTLRDRQNAIRIRLGLEDEALLVGLRLVGIALGGDYRVRHLHVLEVDGRDRDPGVVVIEHALDELLGAPCDLGPGGADEELIERAAAHDLADGALGDLTQGALGIAHPEELLHRIRELVLHGKMQIDQVDVGGEHARLEVARIHARHIDDVDALDRPGETEVEARRCQLDEAPEALHHAPLGLLDLVDAVVEPHDHDGRKADEEQRAAVAPPAAAGRAQQRLELALPALQALIEVGAAWTASPWTLRTAWLVPGH